MKPRINFITLAVQDLEKSLTFYRDGLGLPTRGIIGSEFTDDITGASGTIAFLELHGGLMLGLYARSDLAKDASIMLGPISSTEFSLGYAVHSKEAVDHLLKHVEAVGGILTRAPHERPWGVYSGYFKDLDGHLWEVTWDPRIELRD